MTKMRTLALLMVLGIVFAVINDASSVFGFHRHGGNAPGFRYGGIVKRRDVMDKAFERMRDVVKREDNCVSEGEECRIFDNDDDNCCPGLECECIGDDCVCAADED